MSRLMQRLRAMDAQADPKRRAERESHQLAGDGLEMAARVALESWQERRRHPDESDVFLLGYRLACHELALVFRAMRKGEPPTREEFEELRRLVFEDAAGEPAANPFCAHCWAFFLGHRSGKCPRCGVADDCTPAPPCAPAEEDAPAKA